MKTLTLALFAIGLAGAYAQDANCDFYQNVQPGQSYNLYSPNYPNNYLPGVQCRWIMQCPTGYNCKLDCTDINLPQSPQCQQDRLLISKSGDPQLSGADVYCGQGTASAVSTGTSLSVGKYFNPTSDTITNGLISSLTSRGGRFLCQVTTQRAPSQSCGCGYKRQSRIVGGMQTGVNEFPMMAGIIDTQRSQIKCGAVIISTRYVLTAAHCLSGSNSQNLAVIVGEHDVTTGDSPATRVFSIADYLIHPQFSQLNYDYDIAIIMVAGQIIFSDRVGPVCLPFKFVNSNLTGSVVTALGWGAQFIGGPYSNVLRKVNLDVISQPVCQITVPTVTPRQLCTFTLGKDACQGDGGGPLLLQDPSTGLLFHVGVISYGLSCGVNSVSTRVTSVLNWITSNTPEVKYCRK